MLARSKKIMDSARGKDCTLRLTDVCNYNSETTVAAHIGRNRGMAIKAGDNMIVYACSACHAEIDKCSRSSYADDKLRALEETQQQLIDSELMTLK